MKTRAIDLYTRWPISLGQRDPLTYRHIHIPSANADHWSIWPHGIFWPGSSVFPQHLLCRIFIFLKYLGVAEAGPVNSYSPLLSYIHAPKLNLENMLRMIMEPKLMVAMCNKVIFLQIYRLCLSRFCLGAQPAGRSTNAKAEQP